MREQDIQNKIRLSLSQRGKSTIFRNNVGQAWTGNVRRLPNGDIVIQNPRPVNFGLCTGSSDLIGWTREKITPEMVGKEIAVFTALEVKRPGKQPTVEQRNFIAQVLKNGGRAGVCTNEHSAIMIAEGKV